MQEIATDQQREHIIQDIAEIMRKTPFTFEFRVKEKPKGIKIVYERTQEEMDAMLEKPMGGARDS